MKEFKTKPKNLGVKLGTVNYGSRGNRDAWEVYNKNGVAYAVKYSKGGRRWLVSKEHIAMGYMLKKLGIEFNAGGGIFRHYTLPKNVFNGKTRKQIIKIQNSV